MFWMVKATSRRGWAAALGCALLAAVMLPAGATARPLIQGGTAHYSPFLVRVAYGPSSAGWEDSCSGTVIAPSWVLTAGHCVGNAEEAGSKTFPASKLWVDWGNINWKAANVASVAEARRPSGYYSNHTIPPFNDVGLLHLSSPVTVEPIVLATPATYAAEVKEGAQMSAAGFGLTSPNGREIPEDMMLVTGLVVEELEEPGNHNDVIIGSSQQKGTCEGDSGGPFIDKSGEEIGTTSAGPGNACNETFVQRIDVEDSWIAEQIETAEPPTVTSITPSEGPAGTEVAIHGAWMSKTTGVEFGSTPASEFTVVSGKEVRAKAPAGSGAVDVRAINAKGASPVVAGDSFQYRSTSPPVVSKIEPNSGPEIGRTKVTITGTELANATEVHFGTVEARSFTVDSNESITAETPVAAAGKVNVTVTTPAGTSAVSKSDVFNFKKAKPKDYKWCYIDPPSPETCFAEPFKVYKKLGEFRMPPEQSFPEEPVDTFTLSGKNYTFIQEIIYEGHRYKLEMIGTLGTKGVIAGREISTEEGQSPFEAGTFTLTPEKG